MKIQISSGEVRKYNISKNGIVFLSANHTVKTLKNQESNGSIILQKIIILQTLRVIFKILNLRSFVYDVSSDQVPYGKKLLNDDARCE